MGRSRREQEHRAQCATCVWWMHVHSAMAVGIEGMSHGKYAD